MLSVVALFGLLAVPGFAADKLIVKDAGGTNTVFNVTDVGLVGINTGASTPAGNLHIIGDSVNNTIYEIGRASCRERV